MTTSVVAGSEGGLRTLALAVLRQSVDDIRSRPYRERRHRCCPLPPDECAHRFLANGQSEAWCETAGLTADAIRSRLRIRLDPFVV
jgi:hypothetical protein